MNRVKWQDVRVLNLYTYLDQGVLGTLLDTGTLPGNHVIENGMIQGWDGCCMYTIAETAPMWYTSINAVDWTGFAEALNTMKGN